MVKEEFIKIGVPVISVELGEVQVKEALTETQTRQIKQALSGVKYELLDDKKTILVEKVKTSIVELVHFSDDRLITNLSEYLSKKHHHDYTYLANLFSEAEGVSIQQFIIAHKIERAKELIGYNELSLTKIALKLHYSSVAHLSTQFKKVTGLTPSDFKRLKGNHRTALENV